MSAMRSASSTTTISTVVEAHFPPLQQVGETSGHATTTSTPLRSALSCGPNPRLRTPPRRAASARAPASRARRTPGRRALGSARARAARLLRRRPSDAGDERDPERERLARSGGGAAAQVTAEQPSASVNVWIAKGSPRRGRAASRRGRSARRGRRTRMACAGTPVVVPPAGGEGGERTGRFRVNEPQGADPDHREVWRRNGESTRTRSNPQPERRDSTSASYQSARTERCMGDAKRSPSASPTSVPTKYRCCRA